GRILNSSRSWPVHLPDVADRDFFQALTQDASLKSFIGQPTLNRANGTWSVMFARGFTAPDGRLLGIVSSSIRLAYYEQIYSQISLAGSGSFALYRRDGMLLARYPPGDPNIGRSYLDDASIISLQAATDRSSIRRISVLDGKYRVIAPRSVAHYPLIVAATNTVQAILSPWHGKAQTFGIATVVIELALAGLVALGVRHLRGYEALEAAERARTRAEAELVVAEERERAAQALRAQEHRFDTALHNMLQGLLMISSSGQLLVVNNRFYELFGMPPGSLTVGIGYLEMTGLVVELGNVCAEDMRAVRERRADLIARDERAVAMWELSDGRAFNVTHQPMEEGWLTTFEDVTRRRRAEAMMVHLAHHDALTDLPNRVMFRTKLEEALAFARRGQDLALLCLDLDQFKTVNETLGHPTGDALLKAVAQRLTDGTREIDTVARLGGDEFSIVQTAIEKPTDATGFANRLLNLMSTPFEVAGHQIVIGTSIGIALAPQDGLDADQLLRCADMALYRAKQDGRGVYRMFQAEMDAEMQARRLLELDLRLALPVGQLEVFYQPQVDLRAGAMTGV
ncbi:MAG TPA: diguanylate cyclase, partial [Rhodanobacter sp.]